MRPVIVVDFDGTLVKNEWPFQSRTWMPGAVEALAELSKRARVLVVTSRIAPVEPDSITPRHPAVVQGEKNYIRHLLDEAGLYEVELWDHPWKPGADAYVDDKAVHYAGRRTSWTNLVPKLLAMIGEKEEVVGEA